MNEIEVELHSTEPTAVEATRRTLEMLKPGNHVLVERNGRFFIQSTNVGYVRFAVERQGYVKKVLP